MGQYDAIVIGAGPAGRFSEAYVAAPEEPVERPAPVGAAPQVAR